MLLHNLHSTNQQCLKDCNQYTQRTVNNHARYDNTQESFKQHTLESILESRKKFVFIIEIESTTTCTNKDVKPFKHKTIKFIYITPFKQSSVKLHHSIQSTVHLATRCNPMSPESEETFKTVGFLKYQLTLNVDASNHYSNT